MKQNKAEKKGGGEKSNVKELNPPPGFIEERQQLWDKLKADYDREIAGKVQSPIKISLPDGKVVDGYSWKTTAYDVAKGIRYLYISLVFLIVFCYDYVCLLVRVSLTMQLYQK